MFFKKKIYTYTDKKGNKIIVPKNKIAFMTDPIRKGIKDFAVISAIIILILLCIAGLGFIIYTALHPPIIKEVARAVI
jgi:hypothetical protein